MAWYWIVLIVCFVCFFPLGLGVYWFNVKKPQLEYDFKTLFGVLHSDERIKVETAVEEKMRLLTLNWQEEIRKADLGGKKSDGLKEAEEDYERAERLAHRFRIAGW